MSKKQKAIVPVEAVVAPTEDVDLTPTEDAAVEDVYLTPAQIFANELAAEPKAETAASDIPRFWWDAIMAHGAFVEGKTYPHSLPKDALYYLKRETRLVKESCPIEPWAEEVARKVGLSQMICPDCQGRREVGRDYTGQTTGIRVSMPDACKCLIYLGFFPKFMNPANVPTDYRNITIHNLKDYAANFRTFNDPGAPKAFADLLDQVRQNPYSCFLLVGPAGTGKTTLMTAMYRHALQTWSHASFVLGKPTEAVWKVDGPALSKQFRDWEMRNRDDRDSEASVPPPEVTATKILAAVRAGLTPCVFIDEIDKIKLDSDFQAKAFHDIITVAQANGGMVCASSNLGAQNLMEKLGTQVGAAVVRRLCGSRLNPDTPDDPANGDRGGFLVDFWAGTCKKNYNFRAPTMEGAPPATPFPTATVEKTKQGTVASSVETSGTTPAEKPKATSGTGPSSSTSLTSTHTSEKQGGAQVNWDKGGMATLG